MKKIAIEEHWDIDSFQKISTRLKDMDEANIDMQVLSAMILPNYGLSSASDAASWAKRTNDELFRVISKHPTRFSAFTAVSLQDPDTALSELERGVTQFGFKGLMIGGIERVGFLDEKKYCGILETAEKLDVPIYLHPKMPPPNMIEPYLTYPVLAGAMWGFAAEAGLHAMRLICSGVFDKYPKLKIILGHMGEGIPYYLWRIDKQWEKGLKGELPGLGNNVLSPLKKKPSEYFKENFYITTSGMFWHPVLKFACSVLGANRILFAVDYPPESSLEGAQFIESAPICDSDKEMICYLNAKILLKL